MIGLGPARRTRPLAPSRPMASRKSSMGSTMAGFSRPAQRLEIRVRREMPVRVEHTGQFAARNPNDRRHIHDRHAPGKERTAEKALAEYCAEPRFRHGTITL